MANLALREVKAAQTPLKAAIAFALKTFAYILRESALRLVYKLY